MLKKIQKVLPQIIFLIAFVCGWQLLYQYGNLPPLLFPSIGSIGKALVDGFTKNNMGAAVLFSLSLIGKGLVLGIALALVLSSLAIVSKSIFAIYNMLVAVFDLIPGVALFPIAILFFGTGEATIIFIVVHSVLWPMSRSILDGFNSIPNIYLEAGENIGLRGLGMVAGIYIPAAFPRILSGLKVGWARAWRGLMSAEMVFGATGAGAGLGFYIQYRRNFMDSAGLYASILVILVIGLVVEYGIFRVIENKTIRKWGMVR